MIEVQVLYEEGDEEQAKEVLRVLETLESKLFCFIRMAYKKNRGLLLSEQLRRGKR